MFRIPYEQFWYARAGVQAPVTEADALPPDIKRKPDLSSGGLFGGGGAGGSSSGGPGGAGPTGRRVDALPRHLYQPDDAYPLELPENRIPVAIPAGSSLVVATWPTVPQGQFGVVRKFGAVITAGNVADARITTRINLAPCQPFPRVIGAVGTLEAPQEVCILIPSGGVFSVLVTNTGVVALSIAVRTSGWLAAMETF